MHNIAHQAFALVAGVALHEGTFDETPQQVTERQKLVAEIFAAQEVSKQWLQGEPTAAQKWAINRTWEMYAIKARRALLIRKVDLKPIEQTAKAKQTR